MPSSDNGNDPRRQFPFHPPEYWLITEEWTEVIETGSALSPEGIKRMAIKRRVTRPIDCHPIGHHAAGTAHGLRDYIFLAMVPITKKHYDWHMSMFQTRAADQAAEIADKVDKENQEQPGPGLRLVRENESEETNNSTGADLASEGNQRGESTESALVDTSET